MLPTFTIVFREVLEIALILGIVLAATQGMKGRVTIVLSGLGIGILGSGVVAYFTQAISEAVEGTGQEIFNACVLFTAVLFLGWTVIWMKRHAREMSQNIKAIGQDVKEGRKSLYALIGVVAFATLREGSEIVLFTYGMNQPPMQIIFGSFLGILAGSAVGFMLYFGLLKTFKRHLFTVTSWMLVLLTAGMAAKGTGFLIAAGVMPELYPQVWDSSSILAAEGIVGETLGILVGYTPRPTGAEVSVYILTLAVLSFGYLMAGRKPSAMQAQVQSQPSKSALMIPAE